MLAAALLLTTMHLAAAAVTFPGGGLPGGPINIKSLAARAAGKVKSRDEDQESSKARMLDSAADVAEYEYYSDDEGEGGGALAVLTKGVVGAAVLGVAGVSAKMLRPTISRWASGVIARLRPEEDDEGPIPDDADIALPPLPPRRSAASSIAAKSSAPGDAQTQKTTTTTTTTTTKATPMKTTTTKTTPKTTTSPAASEPAPALTGAAALLGSMLLRVTPNGTRLEAVETASVLQGKTVALYVSSLDIELELKTSNMTRNLLSTHLEVVRARTVADKKHALEMVYVSLDDDPKAFRQVVRSLREPTADGSGQPGWLAVPHCDEEVRAGVIQKYVTGGEVPAVVIISVDPPSASSNTTTTTTTTSAASPDSVKLVNSNALAAMLSNPDGFPWPAKSLKTLLGLDFNAESGAVDESIPLVAGSGSNDTIAHASTVLAGKKYVGLYFSAAWCPPCKAFTPTLCETYSEILGKDKDAVEFMFVSHDKTPAEFNEYRKKMPWPALAYQGTGRSELQRQLSVKSLPTLIILDAETGEVVTSNGRSAVAMDPLGANFPWHPLPVQPLDTAESLAALPVGATPDGVGGDGLALVLFTDKTARAPLKKATTDAFAALAKDRRDDPAAAGNDGLQFFAVSRKDSQAAVTLRSLCGLGDEFEEADGDEMLFGDLAKETDEKPTVVLFDFANSRFFTSEAAAKSQGALAFFIEDCKNGNNGGGTSFAVLAAPEDEEEDMSGGGVV